MMLIISFCVSISWKRPVRGIISHVRGSRSLRKKRIKPNTTPTWVRANCPRFSTRERKIHRSAARSMSNEAFYTYILYLLYIIYSWIIYVFLQARDRYEKILEDVTGFAPRYMEEMESVFDQSQEEEKKRISFLKQAFLSIHRHLDITNNERFKMATRIWLQHYISCHKTIVIVFLLFFL